MAADLGSVGQGVTMKGIEQQGKGTSRIANSAVPTNGAEATSQGEATIDQVRALLFGGAQRSIENKLTDLREELQASLKQVQADLAKELAAVQAKVTELERDTEVKRLASLRDVGTAISQLGATISGLGSGLTGK
ncbi:hypothetical protein J6497_21545 [Bradyrhizobium sp. CNPSo 4026]|nr:hypothetical protein [Bradyrhizobium cenepequi]